MEVTSEEEGHGGMELLEVGPQARGWMAAKYCIYPQTIILGLESRTMLEKLQVMANPWAVPTKEMISQLIDLFGSGVAESPISHFFLVRSFVPVLRNQF